MSGAAPRPPNPEPPVGGHRPPGWPVAVGLLATVAGSAGFVIAYVRDAGLAWLGGSLVAALLGLGVALAYWGRDLAGDETLSGPYPVPNDDPEARKSLGDRLQEEAAVLTRRRFLVKLLVVAGALFALSQAVLVASLGPRPKRDRSATGWGPGTRLVTVDGRPVTREALAAGGFLVAFPEGGDEAAGSQVALLRFPNGELTPLPGRETWSPEGFVAYSRVCTHAGCAVAQYIDEEHVLACPCHQSTFDVLDGARPLFGPAGRALPQLPLAIDEQGRLVALSDFTEPVGPGAWNAT
jgi:ubiquinol-cytochrome c reductase iron-sulfur subunit